MAGQIQLAGSISAGPVSATDSSFPGGVTSVDLETTPNPKSYVKREHKEIPYVGVTDQALDFTGISARFVYLRSDAAITFKVNGGSQAIPLHGIWMQEFPDAAPCTGITVTGTMTIEYFIAGE